MAQLDAVLGTGDDADVVVQAVDGLGEIGKSTLAVNHAATCHHFGITPLVVAP